MKKWLSALLAMALLLACTGALADDQFSLNDYSSASKVFNIEVDSEKDLAYIETSLTTKDLSFSHQYESNYLYSSIRNDIIVLDYYSSGRFPVVRTWINYAADKPQYIHSVSFEVDGKTYMFTDVGDKDRVHELENGYVEQLLIRYGSNNFEFFATVAAKAMAYSMKKYSDNPDPDLEVPKMKMTLYGLETIEAEVPEGFWIDMAALVLPLLNNEYIGFISQNDGNPCKVTE